jgi:hypothetical protein
MTLMEESYRLTTLQSAGKKPPKSILWPDLLTYRDWCDRQVTLMWAKGLVTARVHVEIINDQKHCCVMER